MLSFQNHSAAIDEPKNARMEQRTKPRVKAQIQQAAALLGVDETTFVTSVALERAQQTIAEHERTVLTAADRDVFFTAMERPAGPSDALREAARMNKETVQNGG